MELTVKRQLLKMNHQTYMKLALKEAKQAYQKQEIPIGAILVCHDKIIASAQNSCESDHSPLGHAELKVIKEATEKQGDWRLTDHTLYVTLEPCPMCLGALFQARLKTVVFGCPDTKREKSTAFPSLKGKTQLSDNNHNLEIIENVLQTECSQLLKDFFKERR